MEETFNIKLFISLIRSRISIWDCKSAEFKDKIQKRKDWLAVCAGIVPNYIDKNNKEKKLILLRLQSKWKALRDGFVRNLRNRNKKTGSAAALAKKYTYHDQMLFLVGKCKRDLSSLTCNIDISKEKDVIKDSEESEDLRRDILKDLTVKVPETLDEDRQFFLSLLKDFKRISEDFKLDAKGEIINVLRHYVNKTNKTPSESPKVDCLRGYPTYLRGDLQLPEEISVKIADKCIVIGKELPRENKRRYISENEESRSSGIVEREPEYAPVTIKNEDVMFKNGE